MLTNLLKAAYDHNVVKVWMLRRSEREEEEGEVDKEWMKIFVSICWYLLLLAWGIPVCWYQLRQFFPAWSDFQDVRSSFKINEGGIVTYAGKLIQPLLDKKAIS